jgi:hypothetical protein
MCVNEQFFLRGPIPRSVVALLQIAVLICSVAVPLNAQDAVGVATLGVLLNKLMDQVDQIVMDARNSANSVGMEMGREAALAIANARTAYSDALNDTIDKLDPKIKDTTDKLQSLVEDIKSGAVNTVDLATSRAQQIVNSLPFRNNEPQVTAITPRFAVPSEKTPIVIRFQGNFPNSSMSGFEPFLLISGKRYQSQNSTQQLSFVIPSGEEFHFGSAENAGKLQFAQVTLAVPWRDSSWWGLVHTRKEDHFNLIIGSLPSSPGNITIIHTTTSSTPVTQDAQSGPFHQASTRENGNNDDKGHPYLVTPDAGWHVVRGSTSFKVFSAQGDWSQSFVSDDADRIQYSVTTIHHGAGVSGSVDFRILYKETTTQVKNGSTSENMDLEWGDSKSFSYPAGSWKIVFTSFDGKHFEITGSDQTNPFLDVKNLNGSMVVSTRDPATLNWP